MSTDPPALIRSRRVYRLLLGVYPPSFRKTYAAEMARVFGDHCRSAYERGGMRCVIDVWARGLADLILNASGEWIEQLREWCIVQRTFAGMRWFLAKLFPPVEQPAQWGGWGVYGRRGQPRDPYAGYAGNREEDDKWPDQGGKP